MGVRSVSHANRGRSLEVAIEQANASYLARGIAVVQKVPTPTKVLPDRRGGVKVVRTQSTVDFVGAWAGRPIAFDAKQSREGTRFSLSYVEPHQVEFLRHWQESGGVAFLLVELVGWPPWIIPFDTFEVFWNRWRSGGRASIARDELEQLHQVLPKRGIAVDYLTTLEALLGPQNGGAEQCGSIALSAGTMVY